MPSNALARCWAARRGKLLAETMFRDILRQVRLARGLTATFVVTGDDRVAAIAASPVPK